MKNISYLFILFPLLSWAQVRSLNLAEAQELAKSNRTALKNQALNLAIAEQQVKRANSAFLPQITGSFDMRYNTRLQTNVLPAEAFGFPGGANRAVQFGTTYNNQAGLNFNQTLFDAKALNELKQLKNQVIAEDITLEAVAIDSKIAIAQAYYDVVLKQEQVKLSQANLNRAKENYKEALQKNQEGTLLKNELSRFLVDLKNAESSTQRSINQLELSKLLLSQELGIEDEIMVKDSLTSLVSALTAPNKNELAKIRPEYRLAENKVVQAQLNAKKEQQNWLPQLSLYAFVAAQQLSNSFNPIDNATWYPYNYVGAKLSIPIFDGGLRRKTIAEQQLKIELAKNNLTETTKNLAFEEKSTSSEWKLAFVNLNTAQENHQLAQNLYADDLLRFKQGTITQSDLLTTERSLKEAESNLMQEIYNYLLADLNYQKARGNF